MTNEEHNQRQQQQDLSTNSDVGVASDNATRLRHDELFKKVMSEPVAAREFLKHYLPVSFKNKINLNNVKIEKESFVTEDLRKRLSDVVYSVPLKNNNIKDSTTESADNGKAYVYVLIEHQSSSDYWIAFRLWQYMLLLCERHRDANKKNKQARDKLPLICPIVVYANDKPYNAPRSFWELFEDSKTAKELMSHEYLLVDLQKQSDDEIEQKKHLGMMEYMLKHIKARDILNLWQSLLEKFASSIEIDKENGFIYIKWLLWYSDAKVAEDKQVELAKIIAKHLNKVDQEGLMRTIADKYIDEGTQKGMVQGMQIGRNEGMQIGRNEGMQIGRNEGMQIGRTEGMQIGRNEGMQIGRNEGMQIGRNEGMQIGRTEGMQIGEAKRTMEVAKNMLSNNYSIPEVSRITGLSISELNQLLKS